MRVHLDAIMDTGLHLQYQLDPSGDEGLKAVVESGEAIFLTPVKVSLDLNRVMDTVEVRGHLFTRVRLTCGRCLAEFDRDIASDIFCVFAPRPEERRHPKRGDLELSAEDVGLIFFDGRTIDTTEAVREEVLAAIPYRALCRKDCRGLCPHCGADLNTAGCTCGTKRSDPRLAALSRLDLK